MLKCIHKREGFQIELFFNPVWHFTKMTIQTLGPKVNSLQILSNLSPLQKHFNHMY